MHRLKPLAEEQEAPTPSHSSYSMSFHVCCTSFLPPASAHLAKHSNQLARDQEQKKMSHLKISDKLDK
jgi:hypothetical protein